MVERRGGVLVKHGGDLRFLPAASVIGITPCPPISRVPGAPASLLGIVHTGGEIVPVVVEGNLTEPRRDGPLVVCRYLGEPIGLLGFEIVGAGMFDVDPAIPMLDLGATFATLRSARWMALGGIDG
jgi:purine-binding chemotaxis protein CheW